MHQIRYECHSEKTPSFYVFKYDKKSIKNFTLYNTLSGCVKESTKYFKYTHSFLLDDNRFSFFRFDILQSNVQKFSIKDLEELVSQKNYFLKKKGTNAIFLSSYIDKIYVDGESQGSLVGKSGDISFKLYLVYIDSISLNIFDAQYGELRKQKRITVVPQSLYTILFIKNFLHKENFILLYIDEFRVKAILIEGGFYQYVKNINFGLSGLRKMYKDNGISGYRGRNPKEIESNALANNLISEMLEFYFDTICKWLTENDLCGKDIFIVSSAIKNNMFVEKFNQSYNKVSSNYIIPLGSSDKLETFDYKWSPEYMDILVYMNQ